METGTSDFINTLTFSIATATFSVSLGQLWTPYYFYYIMFTICGVIAGVLLLDRIWKSPESRKFANIDQVLRERAFRSIGERQSKRYSDISSLETGDRGQNNRLGKFSKSEGSLLVQRLKKEEGLGLPLSVVDAKPLLTLNGEAVSKDSKRRSGRWFSIRSGVRMTSKQVTVTEVTKSILKAS